MREINMELRVVVYREDDMWVAHCLEFDLIGHGETKDEAFAMLSEAIRIQLEESLTHNNPRNLFHPADSETFHRFAMGQNQYKCELKLQVDAVSLPSFQAREYVDEKLVLA